jgi:sulfur-oxidizing protein SoxX
VKRLLVLLAVAASSAVLAAAPDVLEESLAAAGDAERGREIFLTREGGHCVICHQLAKFSPTGNVGPSLDGIGGRLSAAQLRLRIVDITRVNPDATMPAFFRSEGLTRVAAAHVGKTLLSAQQVEDLVAFLAGLR